MAMIKRLAFLLWMVAISCQEPIDYSLLSENVNTLAVEAVLTNEIIPQRVKLTLPYQRQNGLTIPATGALISISDGSSLYLLTEKIAGSGEYFSQPFPAVSGRDYRLQIEYRGQTFDAIDRSVGVEPLPDLRYQSADDLNFELTFNPSGNQANYIIHQINWRHTPQCQANSFCEGLLVYYDLKTIDANEVFRPEKETFLFPINTVVIRKKHSVSEGYRNYLRAILSETEWRGGAFDVEPANAPTNLTSGAIGYFAVTSILSDTVRVQ
jgi:Domain of unknown function (DUF4249)